MYIHVLTIISLISLSCSTGYIQVVAKRAKESRDQDWMGFPHRIAGVIVDRQSYAVSSSLKRTCSYDLIWTVT